MAARKAGRCGQGAAERFHGAVYGRGGGGAKLVAARVSQPTRHERPDPQVCKRHKRCNDMKCWEVCRCAWERKFEVVDESGMECKREGVQGSDGERQGVPESVQNKRKKQPDDAKERIRFSLPSLVLLTWRVSAVIRTPVSNTEEVAIRWAYDGSAFLALCTAHIDETNANYYGTTTLYFVSTLDVDNHIVNLDKDGARSLGCTVAQLKCRLPSGGSGLRAGVRAESSRFRRCFRLQASGFR
eukprot:3641257-Rhodomonas_salina.1